MSDYAKSERAKKQLHDYYENNKEEKIKYISSWNRENKEHRREWFSKYLKSQKGLAQRRRNGNNTKDKKRGFDTSNNVTPKWIIENIFASKCIYCGDSDWQHLGCDRIDNDKPHTSENIVCSCAICNTERQYKKLSVEEFIEYRKQHPRACDTKKEPSINDKGFLIKKPVG